MDIFIALYIILSACGIGRLILSLLRFKFDNLSQKLFHETVFGLGVLGYLIYLMGLTGLITRVYILWLILFLNLVSLKKIIEILKDIFSLMPRLKPSDFSLCEKTILFFLFIISLNTLGGALAPPTGHDSLAYRLPQLRLFIVNQKIFYIPYSRESLWPYLTEMLFLLGMALRSDIAAKLIAMSFGFIGCLGVYSVGRQLQNRTAGLLSASVFLFTPAIFTQMTYSYVDITMSVFSFALIISIYNFLRNDELKWAALAGVYGGFVLSVKYIGFLILAAAVIVAVPYILKKKSRSTVNGIFLFSIFTIICSFIWYLRAFLIKGNPFYPFFANLFGIGWPKTTADIIGKRFGLVGLIRLPWDITIYPDRFGGEHIGAIYLLFLPLYYLVVKNRKPYAFFLLFPFVYTILWFYIDPNITRFLFPALMPLAVIVGAVLFNLKKEYNLFNGFMLTVFIALSLFSTALSFYFNYDKYKVSFGLEAKDSYLLRNERTYEMAQFIDKNLPNDAKIFMIGEIRSYYLNRPYVHFSNFIYEEKKDPSKWSVEGFLSDMKRIGAGYVILEKDTPFLLKGELRLSESVEKYLKSKKPIFSSSFSGKGDYQRKYYLYRL